MLTASVNVLGAQGVVVAEAVGVGVALGTVTEPAVGVEPVVGKADADPDSDTDGLVEESAVELDEPPPSIRANAKARTITAAMTRAIESRRHQYVELGSGPCGFTTEGKRNRDTVFEA